jgi:hypothetical protein
MISGIRLRKKSAISMDHRNKSSGAIEHELIVLRAFKLQSEIRWALASISMPQQLGSWIDKDNRVMRRHQPWHLPHKRSSASVAAELAAVSVQKMTLDLGNTLVPKFFHPL